MYLDKWDFLCRVLTFMEAFQSKYNLLLFFFVLYTKSFKQNSSLGDMKWQKLLLYNFS